MERPGRSDSAAAAADGALPRETDSTLPGLLASVLRGSPGEGEPAELAAALRWAVAATGVPAARMVRRLADRLARGDDLLRALRDLGGGGDGGPRWAATAVEVHREHGGDLPALLQLADRAAVERSVVAAERAGLRTEARLIVAALVAQPVVLAGVGALLTDGVAPLDLALLGVALLLTLLGGWWLTRVTRPPFDWRPWRRNRAADVPADDLLDRATLACAAGLGLDEAVRWAAGSRPDDEVGRITEVLRARTARRTADGKEAQGPGPNASAPTVGLLQAAATDVRRRQLAGTRAGAQRIRWLAAIPYVVSLLPASALVVVALL